EPRKRRPHLAADAKDQDIAVDRREVIDQRLGRLRKKGLELIDVVEPCRQGKRARPRSGGCLRFLLTARRLLHGGSSHRAYDATVTRLEGGFNYLVETLCPSEAREASARSRSRLLRVEETDGDRCGSIATAP